MKLTFSNLLTILLVASAFVAVLVFALGQIQTNNDEYQSYIKYSTSKLSLGYDYSCDQSVYGLFVNLTNSGHKTIDNFQVSVTNELCVGGVPSLPVALNSGQSIQFYVYTTEQNGTLSITGNNTNLFIRF